MSTYINKYLLCVSKYGSQSKTRSCLSFSDIDNA